MRAASLAEPSGSASQVEAQASSTAEAIRIDHAPKLDGTLNDPLWELAKPITDFRQQEPLEGQPATEKTEVRILYTRHAVYFGIHCFDSEPSRIIASGGAKLTGQIGRLELGVMDVDTRLVFFKDWFVDAHMAGTNSPGSPTGNSEVGASLTYRSNWVEGIAERRKTGPNFNPEVGFVERTDSNETYGDLTFKVRPSIPTVRELQFEGFMLHA
ncbi:MAG TPA: hypothetical protein VGR55_03820 [Candidatus Acidoferrum sp.]|nr:hypothetical protein [Candidatus Acidoferrum sp.]